MLQLKFNKRVRNFIIFYGIISVLFFTTYTFSRYITGTSGTATISIAKFNVKVNDIDVVLGEKFTFDLQDNSNIKGNKMAPATDGYFEIVIDPNMTEVSLEYEFSFDLSKIDNSITLERALINDSEEVAIVDNKIVGDILLPNGSGFTEKDKKTIKVYWKWPEEEIINPTFTGNDTDIEVSAIIRQKLK